MTTIQQIETTQVTTLPRIKMKEKLGFGAFSTASNVVYQFRSLYYLFFLTNVLMLDVKWAGYIATIGMFWDAINDPMVGFWAANHRFKNGEHFRPMALWFALPWAVTIVLMFTNFGVGRTATIVIAIAIYLLFELFNTFVGIPYNSMAGLATDLDEDRRSINVFRNLGGGVGSAIGAVACLPLLRLFGGLDAKGNLNPDGGSRGFFLVAVVMGLVCIIGCLAHYFTTRERVEPIADEEEHLSFRRILGMLLRSRIWVLNTLYILCYGVINLMLMSSITYYATYILGSTAAATMIQAAYLVASLLSSFLVSPIDKAIGRKKTMILAAFFFILGKIWFVIDPFSIGAIYVNAVSVGIAVTITFVMFNTNRNNIVDLIEWKEGRRLDSMVSTVDNLASKSATAMATLAMTHVLSLKGFDSTLNVQPDAVVRSINAFLGWVPMIIGGIMLLIVSFMNIEEEMNTMHQEKKAAGLGS